MTNKICSFCFLPFKAVFDPNGDYQGEFCSPECRYEWMDQRGMLRRDEESSGTGVI